MVRDRRTLELLVGHLVHATKFIPVGKTFLNTLFTTKARMGSGQIRHINLEARAELAWLDWLLQLDNYICTPASLAKAP